jgi:hypothetical protein
MEFSAKRRLGLILSGGVAAGLGGVISPQSAFSANDLPSVGQISSPNGKPVDSAGIKLPVKEIETILRTDGKLTNGVLAISQDRKDLHVIGPGGIAFKPSWQVNHEFAFQGLGPEKAILSGELSLLSKEANPVIDQLIKHGLIFQAFHQHFFDLTPQLFHIHFRGVGHPLDLARATAAVVSVTGTPLPQRSSSEPRTSLDTKKLEDILGGTAEVADDGVVVVSIARKEAIVLDGITLKPETGVSHTVAFQPLDGGKRTAVAPDFALIASEINPLVQLMRQQGFTIHCLYNQETAESPQLYFSHQLAIGDAYELARKVRNGLDRTNTKFNS